MKLRYTPHAKADIAAAHAYIASHNPSAATAVIRRIREIGVVLSQYPNIGRATDTADIYFLPATPYPYLVYFAKKSKEIIIVHVHHEARDVPGREDF